jgi:hypothetical protein
MCPKKFILIALGEAVNIRFRLRVSLFQMHETRSAAVDQPTPDDLISFPKVIPDGLTAAESVIRNGSCCWWRGSES